MSIKTCSRLRLPKRGRTPPCPFSAEGVYPFVSTGIVGQRTMADFQPFPHRPLLSRAQKKAAVATTARLSERVASAFTGEHSENGNPSRVESLPASARRTTPEHSRGRMASARQAFSEHGLRKTLGALRRSGRTPQGPPRTIGLR